MTDWWASAPLAEDQKPKQSGGSWWDAVPVADPSATPQPQAGYRPDTSTVAGRFADLGLSGLTAARELGEETIGQAGDVAMLGAQGMNVIARNFPQLGLHEVPREVLQRYMPYSTEELHQGVGKLLQKVGLPAEYTPATEEGQAIHAVVKYAPLAFSVAKTLEGAFPALGPKGAPGVPLAPAPIQTAEHIKPTVNAAYNAADQAGEQLTEKNYTYLVNSMDQAAKAKNLSPERARDALSILNDFKAKVPQPPDVTAVKLAKGGFGEMPAAAPAPPTSLEINNLRGQLSDLAFGSAKKSERFAASQLLNAYDKAAAQIDRSFPLRQAANQLNVMYERTRTLEKLATKAEGTAAVSGRPAGEILRAELNRLSNNDKWMRQWTAPQQQAIREAIQGGTVQNLLSALAKSQATGPIPATIIGGLTHGVGGAFAGPTVSAAVRSGLRSAASIPTQRRVRELLKLVQAAPAGSALQKRLLARLNPKEVAELIHGALPLAVAGQPSGQ